MDETKQEQPRPVLQPARRDNARIGAVAGTALALVAGAAITFAGSPAASPSTGSSIPAAVQAEAGASASPEASTEPSVGTGADRGTGRQKDHRADHGRGHRGRAFPFPGGMGAPEMGIRGMRFGAVEVTAINGADVSLQTEDGWTRTITVAEGTKLTKAGDAITLADIAVGDAVRFAETRNGDGTYTVTAVAVILPLVAGEVTVRTDATITVRQRDGSTVTVNVNGDTDYVARNDGTATLEDIEVGQFILAQGARNEDGSLDATDVLTGHGGFGPRGQRGDKPHATETPANED